MKRDSLERGLAVARPILGEPEIFLGIISHVGPPELRGLKALRRRKREGYKSNRSSEGLGLRIESP